jgi:hypothetical protein
VPPLLLTIADATQKSVRGQHRFSRQIPESLGTAGAQRIPISSWCTGRADLHALTEIFMGVEVLQPACCVPGESGTDATP